MSDLFDLTDKSALITGGTRGIGLAIAKAFGAHGARLALASRKAEACAAAEDELKAAGIDAVGLPANVSRREEVTDLVARAEAALGGIDIVVGNAGANPVYGPLSGLDDAAFDKVMAVNLRSNLWLAQSTLPGMAARGGGAMILMSSIAALRGSRNLGAYAIAKAADLQLARNLAVEWGGHGIRVNCILPGLIMTEFAKALWDDPGQRQRAEQRTALGRLGTPEDIAGIAVMLASRAGAFVTGQGIVADGGEVVVDDF
jgi:NAD(P)-dependent dehydrogenase (short-subunit alcohol dehydrogenase family)